MKRLPRWITLSTLLALVMGTSMVRAAETDSAKLIVGSPAPRLQTGKWVQGEPVKEFEKDKAYIVEFWATWCGPCRVSIPHLNEIHAKFRERGLVVIGQDAWERDESLVEPFIKKMGDQMTYRVALDDKTTHEKGAMAVTWMEAAGQNGIPTAFLVDKTGRLAWIGHPMQLKEPLVEDVLAGRYDVAKAAAEYENRRKNEGAVNAAYRSYSQAMREKDWDKALAQLDEVEKLLGKEAGDNLAGTRFRVLLAKKDAVGASRLAGEVSDRQPDNAMLQNELAWQLLTAPGIEKRDLALAEKIAKRANDAAQGKDSAVLDTLARALFLQDKKEDAIALQEKAAKLCEEGSDLRKSLQDTLESYRAGKVPDAQ